MLGFSPLAGAALASTSTGDSSQSVTVSISAAGGIERSANNLSNPVIRAAVGFLPEETLFNVVVNGRRLGDIDNSGNPVNTNDAINALYWEGGTSSAAVTAYIEGPMTAYMLANLAAYEGINIAFSSVSMSGVVGTGVTVDVETNVDVNNRLQIAQVSDNLAPAISRTTAGFQPEATLFNTVVNGRNLGDLNDDGSVNVNDVTVALQWDNDSAILPVASASYISGPMNDYMIANFSSFGPAGIGLIFNSPTGVGTVGTGVIVETNKNVATLNNRLQIAQVSDNLAPALSKAAGNQPPNVTLFNTLVNGRKLGDINDDGNLDGQDVFIAQKWDFDNASLSLNDSLYISGPMNDYMIANFSSFGPSGIGLIFNSPTGVGTVGTGVTVETSQVIDVDNVGVTATGVVDVDGVDVEADQVIDVNNVGITATGVVDVDGVDVEADQVIDVNNRREIARTTNNLAAPILRGAVAFEPEKTLFEVVVNGRILGDIANDSNFSSFDAILAAQWEAGTSSAATTAYIEGPMNTYMLGNISAYEGINIAFTTLDATGVVDDVTIVEGAGVSVSLDNINITATGVVGTDTTVETDAVIDVDNLNITATGVVDDVTVVEGTGVSVSLDNINITATGVVEVDGVDVETGAVFDVDNLDITATGVVDDVTVVEGTGVSVSLDNINITATGVVEVDGVDVETGAVIDVDNVSITATGVVGTDTTIETDQVIDINNRQEIARTANNLSTPIARASLNIEPEKTLFNVDVNGRKLGDIDNNGSVTIFDSIAAAQWEAGISSATITAYIQGPMSAYMLGNLSAYEGINIAFTTLDATGAINDVTVTEGTGVTVSLNNTGITATGVVGTVLIWSAIIPNQPANFIPIISSQTPFFTPTNPSQSASFAEIVPSQTSSWTPINPAPSTSWVKTQAA